MLSGAIVIGRIDLNGPRSAIGYEEPALSQVDPMSSEISSFRMGFDPWSSVSGRALRSDGPSGSPDDRVDQLADLRVKLARKYADLGAAYGLAGNDKNASIVRKMSYELAQQDDINIGERLLGDLQMISELSRVVDQERTVMKLLELVSAKWDRASRKMTFSAPTGFDTFVRTLYEMKAAERPAPRSEQTTWRIDSLNTLLQRNQTDLVLRLLAICETLHWSGRNRVIDTLIDVAVKTPRADTQSMELVLRMVELMEGVMDRTEASRNRSIGFQRGSTGHLWDAHKDSTAPSFRGLHAALKEWKEHRRAYDSRSGGGGSPVGSGRGPVQFWMPMSPAPTMFSPATIATGSMSMMPAMFGMTGMARPMMW